MTLRSSWAAPVGTVRKLEEFPKLGFPSAAMKKPVVKRWTSQDIERLRELRSQEASPMRAAVALNRSTRSVRRKAQELGIGWPQYNQHLTIRAMTRNRI